MSESNKDDNTKKPLSLGSKPGGTLSLKGSAAAQVKQNLAGGGGRGTVVEVRRRRAAKPEEVQAAPAPSVDPSLTSELHNLTSEERDARARALREALSQPKKEWVSPQAEGIGQTVVREEEKPAAAAAPKGKLSPEDLRRMELEELERIEAEEKAKQKEVDRQRQSQVRSFTSNPSAPAAAPFAGRPAPAGGHGGREEGESESMRDRLRRAPRNTRGTEDNNQWRGGRLTVTKVLSEDFDRDGGRSLASQKRAREKARKMAMGPKEAAQ